VTGDDVQQVAALLWQHIEKAHPEMQVPPEDRIRREINKASGMVKGRAIFLLYPKDEASG